MIFIFCPMPSIAMPAIFSWTWIMPFPGFVRGRGAKGQEPCVILQASPGHLQAWIRVSTTPLEPAVATSVSKQLAYLYGGDLASTDWRHLGRLAGFTNQKFASRTPSG